MGNKQDYEFTVRILNEDNDDSGVVLRYVDKNNYIRFHHTLDNAYNSDGRVSGCRGKGSFLVLRKGGKETGLKTSTWKYTQGKWHTFRVISQTTLGKIQVYVEGSKLIDYTSSTIKGLSGSCGIWLAHSQMKMDSFSYKLFSPLVAPKPLMDGKIYKPSFGDMQKGGMHNLESGSQDWGNDGSCLGGDWSNKGSYWYQGPCNGGASWFVAKQLMGNKQDNEFTVRILNEDNDDSGVVLRYVD